MAALIDRQRVQALVARGAQLIEVLPAKEYEEDHLPGARSIPLRQINRDTATTLDPARDIVVYCWDAA
jgi:rhodanese-related sulfurtransferase